MTRILVVEDSATQAEELRLILEAAGFTVGIAIDGEQALECLARSGFDLVVSDIMMPGISGYELCRTIKSNPVNKETPVVLLTTLSDPMDIIQGLECEADNFVTKPYDPGGLVDRIKGILENRRLRSEGRLKVGIELLFLGRQFTITSDKQQILDLLISTFEDIVRTNQELRASETERRRANEELRAARDEADRANRAKNEFLSRMSHELRTPLNAVLGFAQLLQIEQLDPGQEESVAHILKAGRHLLALIEEVLDLSRIDAGRLDLSVEPVPVTEVVRETLDLLLTLAAKQAVELRAETPADPEIHVLADHQRLKQALLNLVANAVKYNRPAGHVTVSWTVKDQVVRIDVADTGIGIRPELMGQLFQPFERLAAAGTDVEGTGLGLALSKRLVAAMGGTIEAVSEAGKGSVFSIELPVSGSAHARPAGDDIPPPSATPSPERAATILYVEDNLANIRLVERIFTHRPKLRLLPALQGRLALDLAVESQPDLILLDLHLPDMGGEEVLQRLHADPATNRIPVIILSGDANPRRLERLLAAGATAYLSKPFNVTDFLHTIDTALTTPHDQPRQ